MATALLSPLVFDEPKKVVLTRKVQMKYARGDCPQCSRPMIVSAEMPDAPCVDCSKEK